MAGQSAQGLIDQGGWLIYRLSSRFDSRGSRRGVIIARAPAIVPVCPRKRSPQRVFRAACGSAADEVLMHPSGDAADAVIRCATPFIRSHTGVQ